MHGESILQKLIKIPRFRTNMTTRGSTKKLNEFDQIFDATGLPQIWNWKRLIHWKEFHQKSIQIAKEYRQKIGITRPQQEPGGSYTNPTRDPMSDVWQSDQAPS